VHVRSLRAAQVATCAACMQGRCTCVSIATALAMEAASGEHHSERSDPLDNSSLISAPRLAWAALVN
jgi:hypothetical protein